LDLKSCTRGKSRAAAPDILDHELLSARIAGLVQFGISAKLAAIEAIDRVFPSSPWINY